jgi:hypothetical protein
MKKNMEIVPITENKEIKKPYIKGLLCLKLVRYTLDEFFELLYYSPFEGSSYVEPEYLIFKNEIVSFKSTFKHIISDLKTYGLDFVKRSYNLDEQFDFIDITFLSDIFEQSGYSSDTILDYIKIPTSLLDKDENFLVFIFNFSGTNTWKNGDYFDEVDCEIIFDRKIEL